MWANSTNRIAAGLMDDDSIGESLIMGLDVQCPVLSVKCVFLDEVDIVHAGNLKRHFLNVKMKNTSPKCKVSLSHMIFWQPACCCILRHFWREKCIYDPT